VLASDDGRWNPEREATWEFSIEPRVYQRAWFWPVCASAALLLGWGAWRLRLRQVHQRFALLLDERARASRDLHDTLLQGLVGVAIQLEHASVSTDAPGARREQFVGLRKQIERYIAEARESIWNLRSAPMADRDLVAALVDQVPPAARPLVQVRAAGPVRRYPADVEDQLVLIAREAIANAVNHGAPRSVRVELEYSRASLVLRVIDDGCGFDMAASTHKRYGILGMRERAEQVGGTLTIHAAPGEGTHVEVVIPARQARLRVPA
jgi:signal transduction histidine kinase